MAQKAIREYFGKKLLFTFLPDFMPGFKQAYQGAQITVGKTFKLPRYASGYVAKPDELFGKRGKNDLVFIHQDAAKVTSWIKEKSTKNITVKRTDKDHGISGKLNTFLVEPFIKHDTEFYLAIKSERDHDVIYFSNQGGIEVEENWEKVVEIKVAFTPKPKSLSKAELEPFAKLAGASQKLIFELISGIYQVFRKLDFTYLEINPFTIVDGQLFILDLVARLDDTAIYAKQSEWELGGDIEFPAAFGSISSEPERKIAALDAKSGASLKFSILNPNGRIWMLTSGGGGSVIFADTVGDLGFAKELANYGEYSGNPSTDETEVYANTVIQEMLKSSAKNKVLIIGGGIANFTDVKKTFVGIIKSIQTFAKDIKKQGIQIFVRRGGPNYPEGLKLIKSEVEKLGIPIDVHGPETYMTEVIKIALKNK